MTGENEHVAFDTELCAANPEAAADKIAELEYALAAAGQLDRMRVIGFNKVREALEISETRRKSLHSDWKSLDSICTRQMGRIAELIQMLHRAEWWITTKPDGAAMAGAIRALVDCREDDGTCIRCGAAPRNAPGLCATCVDEDAERAGEIAPAPRPADLAGGPLAWRYLYNGRWYVCDSEAFASKGLSVTPLYARPT